MSDEVLAAENAYWEGLRDAEPEGDAELCWVCDGQQWVTVGVDIDAEDGDDEAETIRCPNCRGSGKEADCWYW